MRHEPLDPSFYRDRAAFDRSFDRVFARSWQVVGWPGLVPAAGDACPVTLLADSLGEPLVLTRDDHGVARCLSNVCTHRANLVVTQAARMSSLLCGYHGRRFALDGTFESMPRVEAAMAARRPCDDLPRLELAALGSLWFTTLDAGASPFAATFGEAIDRVAPLLSADMTFDPERSNHVDIAAHWAVVVENYLEGLHIPFVHPGLAREVELETYAYEQLDAATLQTAPARDADEAIPGTDLAAIYAWLFPNTMLNVYPWGLSLNVVEPISPVRSRVLNRRFVHDPSRLGKGAGGDLDQVDAEDRAVVEQVQRGIVARLYGGGCLSARHEQGVAHFHTLLRRAMAE